MFSIRIKKLREAKKLSQAEFAKILGINSSAIGQYEISKTVPSFKILIKIGEIFHPNLNWLLFGVGDMFINEDIVVVSELQNKITILESENKNLRSFISALESAQKASSSDLLDCLKKLTASQEQIIKQS